jgi:polyvinyl alcohol dehydrogenase (cytochrome)
MNNDRIRQHLRFGNHRRRTTWGLRRALAFLALVCLVCLATVPAAATAGAGSPTASGNWTSGSQSISGNRTQPNDDEINPTNVGNLEPKWVFTDHGDVSATPTVKGNAVYFPDFGGYLNAVNAKNGHLLWEDPISNYDGEPGAVSRNSPLIVGNELILGDNASGPQSGGAHLFAVNRKTGGLIWSVEVDTNPAAIITSDPVAVGREVVVGIASNEEADAESASYPCCSFRGAVVAVNAKTGKMLWKTYTVPSNTGTNGDSNTPCASDNPAAGCGYTGGGVWGTPTIDPATNQVFVGDGNNYTAPDAAVACANAALNATPPTSDAGCTAGDDYFDAVLALNLKTGVIEWGNKVEGWDAWNVACAIGYAPGATWCPSPASPDFDFGGSSPNLITVPGPSGPETLVGDGQKSGIYWAFNPANGNIVWDTLIGPGTSLGGSEWGSAYDGNQIYTAEADPFDIPYTLANGDPVAGGSWAALNPQTGAINWQTATPNGAGALGPVSEAGGVVYAGSMDPSATDPDMFAMDASTGAILWSFDAGSSVNAAPAIVGGTLYWGSGYSHLGPFLPFTGNDKFYAFSVYGR